MGPVSIAHQSRLDITNRRALEPEMPSHKPNLWIEGPLLALLALLWGSSYLFLKIAVAEIPPFTLIAMRVSIAAVFLMIVVFVRGDRLPRAPRMWGMLLIQSMLNSIAAWTILAWGQQYIDSSLASVLNSTAPIFVFFITLLITRHETVSPLKIGGAMLGLVGVVLIVGVEAFNGFGTQLAGALAALTGALLYACAAIYGKNFAQLTPAVTSAATMIWATACLVPLSLAIDRPWTLHPSTNALIAAFILAIFCTGGALLIYFRLVKTLGSLGVTSQAYLRAGVGVVLGVVFLGEQITPLIGLGLAAALLGVVAINLPTRDK